MLYTVVSKLITWIFPEKEDRKRFRDFCKELDSRKEVLRVHGRHGMEYFLSEPADKRYGPDCRRQVRPLCRDEEIFLRFHGHLPCRLSRKRACLEHHGPALSRRSHIFRAGQD